MAQVNYRLIDVDTLDPENAFPVELLTPHFEPVAIGDIQALATQCRQLLQRGDQEAALHSSLENVPYGGDDQGKVGPSTRTHSLAVVDILVFQELHLSTVLEILSSIKQAEMTPILTRIYSSPAGTDLLDVLMK